MIENQLFSLGAATAFECAHIRGASPSMRGSIGSACEIALQQRERGSQFSA